MTNDISKYFSESSVHGITYLAKSRRFERIFWIASLSFSFVACVFLILQLMTKLYAFPNIIYMRDPSMAITEISFPAITICPKLNLDIDDFDYESIQNGVRNKSLKISDLPLKTQKILQVVSLIEHDNLLMNANLSVTTNDFFEVLREFPNFWKKRLDDSVNSSMAEGQKATWRSLYNVEFSEILTRWGFCYSFNLINSSRLLNVKEISSDLDFKVFVNTFGITALNLRTNEPRNNTFNPLKTPNYELGFYALISKWYGTAYSQTYNRFKSPFETQDGFHLIFHHSEELPTTSSIHHYTVPNHSLIFWIFPQLTKIDDSLLLLSPEERNCFLASEKRLKFFKIYNQMNCENECLANHTANTCNCVQFFMMRNESTRICGVNDRNCFELVERSFEDHLESCMCLPSCETLQYEVQKQMLDLVGNDSNKHYSKLLPSEFHVLFKESDFFPFLMKKQFTNLDLLSYIGGFLGLFAGASCISLIEILYYSTVNVLVNHVIYRRKLKVYPMSRNDQVEPNRIKGIVTNIGNQFSVMRKLSIHSFNLIFDAKKGFWERCFWMIMLSLSLFVGGRLIADLHEKLKNNPISLSLNDESFSTEDLPFPAISFVGDFEFTNKRFGYISQMFYRSTKARKMRFNDLVMPKDQEGLDLLTQILVCRSQFLVEWLSDHFNHSLRLMENIRAMGQYEWIKNGSFLWNGETEVPLAEVITKRGLGFSFNMIDDSKMFKLKKISKNFRYRQRFYQNNLTSMLYPLYPGGEKNSLVVTLKNKKTRRIDICLHSGFIVHSPYEHPLSFKDYEFCEIGYGKEIEVLITPEVIISDQNLQRYTKKERQCIFDHEAKMSLYDSYTQKNCEMECLKKLAGYTCECVPYYFISDKKTPVCSIDDIYCVRYWEFWSLQKEEDGIDLNEMCHCLPRCDDVKYNIEIIAKKLALSKDEVVIRFKFKDSHYTPLRRYQQFTFIDFVSQSGGILGLLAGVSLLSIIELFYLLSFRVFPSFVRMVFIKIRLCCKRK